MPVAGLAYNKQAGKTFEMMLKNDMKKFILATLLALAVSSVAVSAQDSKTKTKVERKTSIPQKVHNTFSKHKKSKGYQVKRKKNGTTVKTTVKHD
jgi:hypothetical protein